MNNISAAPTTSVANSSSDTSKFNPSMAIIIAVLISGMLVVVFCSIYIRGRSRGSTERVGQSSGHSNRPVDFYERPGQGLDRALVESLPEVSYSVVKNMKAGKDSLECAVCLERFEEDENLRLLPKCSHVFHSECIDVWFHSHSTCPLCRASLLPTFSEINAGVPAIGDVSRRILQAQEEAYGSARSHVSGDDDASAAADGDLPQGGSESGRRIARMNERNSARLALFRNSNSFGRAARGVEVRERLAAESARYPASVADIDRQPRRASSLNCVNFSLPRSESLDASGSRDFVHGEVFPFGSQRFGAPRVPLRSSLGRTDSSNSGFEPQRVADLGNKTLDARLTAEGSSSLGSSSHGWVNIELQTTESRNMTMNARVYPTMGQSKSLELDPGQVLATNIVQPGTTRKPWSGPLNYGKISNDKTGRVDQRSSKTERAGSFSSLRGSFSLYRSSSDGRSSQVFATDQGTPVPSLNAAANTNAPSRPNVTTDATGSAEIGSGRTPSFARRTMQWLAGHHRKESSSGAAPTDSGSGLQQIVTQE